MLKELDLAMIASKSSRKCSGKEESRERRYSLPTALMNLPPISETQQPDHLSTSLSSVQAAIPNIGSHTITKWRPRPQTLSKNISLDQASSLESIQDQCKSVQKLLSHKVELILEALVMVENIMNGFEVAMREEEWESLGSEDRYFVVTGILEKMISGMMEVLNDLETESEVIFQSS